MKKLVTGLLALSFAFFVGCQSGSSSSQSVAETSAESTTVAETSQLETTAAESTAEILTEPPETTLFHIINHGELYDDFFLKYADSIGKAEYEEVLDYISTSHCGFTCDLDYNDFPTLGYPSEYTIYLTDDYGDVLFLWFVENENGAFTLSMDSYTRTAASREVTVSDSLHLVEIGYWKIETDGNIKTPASSIEELGDWVFALDIP